MPDFFATPHRAIEDRVATFEQRPNEQQLGTDLGYGLMGSSNISLKEDDLFLRVQPERIPIKFAAFWLYLVVAITVVWAIFEDKDRLLLLGMAAFAAVIIAPTFLGILSWIAKETGTEPYLVFNKSNGNVDLPRVSLTFEQTQLREIVFLDRFVEGNRFWQCALLVEDKNCRAYVHLYNDGGSGYGMRWLGVKELDEKIADRLGIDSRRLKFNKKNSESLS